MVLIIITNRFFLFIVIAELDRDSWTPSRTPLERQTACSDRHRQNASGRQRQNASGRQRQDENTSRASRVARVLC